MKNKGGCPKKDEALKRNFQLGIRLTQEEKDILVSHNIFNSKHLRTIIFESISKNKIVINSNKDPKYIAAINYIGINLNQIAKKANSINNLTEKDINKMNDVLELIHNKMLDI